LSKLLYHILMAVPAEKRLVLVDKLNDNEDNWTSNDGDRDYPGAVKEGFFSALLDDVLECAEKGATIGGCAIGVPGMIVGGFVGAIVGGLRTLVVRPLTKYKPLDRLAPLVDLVKRGVQ